MSDANAEKAKEILEGNIYAVIATATKDGMPWNSPVFFAYDKSFNFYWKSWTDNQHSKNIRANFRVFIVVYDGTAPEGTGQGVYIQAKAYELGVNEREEVQTGCDLLARRKNAKPKKAEECLGDYPRRVYRATPEKMWLNLAGEISGNFVDTRIEVDLNST